MIATGPAHGRIFADNPPLGAMQAAGLAQPDPLRPGVDVDLDGRAIGGDGLAREGLYVVGPMARGTFGELFGLPNVSTYASRVASLIAARLPTQATTNPANAARRARRKAEPSFGGPSEKIASAAIAVAPAIDYRTPADGARPQGDMMRRLSMWALTVAAGACMLTASATPGSALSEAQMAADCQSDALRLCSPYIPDHAKIHACLVTYKAYLTPACRAIVAPGKKKTR